jgi:hypothetical protein
MDIRCVVSLSLRTPQVFRRVTNCQSTADWSRVTDKQLDEFIASMAATLTSEDVELA